jgi:hypothetical protein
VKEHDILSRYPKRRPPLTARHQAVYEREYAINRTASGLYRVVHWLESWMHRRIADRTGSGTLLELGAGGLNHVPYERGLARYDVCEPLAYLCEQSPHRGRVAEVLQGYEALGPMVGCRTYDRIASVAVLEHLDNLPSVVAAAALLLQPQGVFQAGVPSEGGLLWGLSWRLTTGLSYRLRTGLDYATLMRHEHVNTVDEIGKVIGCFFRKVSSRRCPPFGRQLSLYTYFEATEPDVASCEAFLSRTNTA